MQCTEWRALDRAATGIGCVDTVDFYKHWSMKVFIKFNTVLIMSEFLATDTEVSGSIPGATRFSE